MTYQSTLCILWRDVDTKVLATYAKDLRPFIRFDKVGVWCVYHTTVCEELEKEVLDRFKEVSKVWNNETVVKAWTRRVNLHTSFSRIKQLVV